MKHPVLIAFGAAAVAVFTAAHGEEASPAVAQGSVDARIYDYHDYTRPRGAVPRDQTRTFELSGPGACGVTETSRISGALEADGSVRVREHRQWRTASGGLCSDVVLETHLTDTQLSIVGLEIPFLGVRSIREAAVPLVTSTMRVGSSWGGAARVTQRSMSTGAVLDTGLATGMGALLAVEDVTVPAGTFTACLKTSLLSSDKFINNTTVNINWWCEGHGVVRQIVVNTGTSASYERQLVSVEVH